MAEHEENIQEELVVIDPYLNSPKEFILEMPPYHQIDISSVLIRRRVHSLLSDNKQIDAYCIACDRDSVFQVQERVYGHVSTWKEQPGFGRHVYKCTRNEDHRYYIYYYHDGTIFVKIGQLPSVADFQIPQSKKYRKILGEEQYKELTRGIGLAAHGVGIGSYVYLRRIFENLIEKAHTASQAEQGFDEAIYQDARMDEKIEMLQKHLPAFLVENRKIYSILSAGIHELDEDTCLKYFDSLRIGIEQILDEEIERTEKVEKAKKAREAVQGILKEITK